MDIFFFFRVDVVILVDVIVIVVDFFLLRQSAETITAAAAAASSRRSSYVRASLLRHQNGRIDKRDRVTTHPPTEERKKGKKGKTRLDEKPS